MSVLPGATLGVPDRVSPTTAFPPPAPHLEPAALKAPAMPSTEITDSPVPGNSSAGTTSVSAGDAGAVPHIAAVTGSAGGLGAAAEPPASPGDASGQSSDGDDSGSESYVFEGPEKNIEICFKQGVGEPEGCRCLSREALDTICAAAQCTILSSISNDKLDAYVLSESSLFVYPHKMVLKTCGKTTLLRCLQPLLRFVADLGLELEWLGYSRKNYTFPDDQVFPHSSFQEEFSYLKKHPHLNARLNGNGYILGPITGDHLLVYVADKCDREDVPGTERTLNIMMFDMEPAVSNVFYKETCPTAREMTERSGIGKLVPGAAIDDCAFDPCGYSMNAVLYSSYTTVHITPEPECSYASFETNTQLKSYTALINNVLSVFRPRRILVTLIADAAGLGQVTESPFDNAAIEIPGASYLRSTTTSAKVEGDCCVLMGNWERRTGVSGAQAALNNDRAHRRGNRINSI